MDKKKITAEDIRRYSGSVHKNIEWAQSLYGESPKKPERPFLKNSHTSDEATSYAQSLRNYEEKKTDYDLAKKQWSDHCDVINSVLADYIKEEAGLYNIPDQYREKVYRTAYDNGHSSGYYQVYNELISLIEVFD